MKTSLLLLPLMSTCTAFSFLSAQEPPDGIFPGEQWQTAAPSDAGVDPEKLERALRYFESECGERGISEMMVVRHGRVLWQGEQVYRAHHVWSCTKSFGGMATGLLVDDGLVTPETRIADLMPLYRETYPEVTVHHMLALTSGTGNQDWEQPDKVVGPLFAPGSHFNYSPGLNILSRVLTCKADVDMKALFIRRIAEPIGLKNFQWRAIAEEAETPIRGFKGKPGQGVEISAGDMARVGWLLLNHGKWEGRQLLSRTWIERSTRPQAGVDTPLYDPEGWYKAIHGCYGYLFWVNGVLPNGERLWPAAPASTYAIQGNKNNICWILPEWDMVVVRLVSDVIVPNKVNSRFLELLAESLKTKEAP